MDSFKKRPPSVMELVNSCDWGSFSRVVVETPNFFHTIGLAWLFLVIHQDKPAVWFLAV
jgi:hypothetical protein